MGEVSAIHIVSHGTPGRLNLGTAELTPASLGDHAGLASWGDVGRCFTPLAWSPDGKLLLCARFDEGAVATLVLMNIDHEAAQAHSLSTGNSLPYTFHPDRFSVRG